MDTDSLTIDNYRTGLTPSEMPEEWVECLAAIHDRVERRVLSKVLPEVSRRALNVVADMEQLKSIDRKKYRFLRRGMVYYAEHHEPIPSSAIARRTRTTPRSVRKYAAMVIMQFPWARELFCLGE